MRPAACGRMIRLLGISMCQHVVGALGQGGDKKLIQALTTRGRRSFDGRLELG